MHGRRTYIVNVMHMVTLRLPANTSVLHGMSNSSMSHVGGLLDQSDMILLYAPRLIPESTNPLAEDLN